MIDISRPIRDGMPVWPGDPATSVTRVRSIAAGDDYNLTAISMSAHTGTHMDAPLHFLDGGLGIDGAPLDALIGPAVVVDGAEPPAATAERVLFRCGGGISPDAARQLAASGARLVGVDSTSVGDEEVHRTLLGAGVWVVEGLDLSAAAPGEYELICLPLRIAGADGAPARAVLRALP